MTTIGYQLGQLRFHSADIPVMVNTIKDWLDDAADLSAHEQRARAIGYINPHVYNISCDHPSVCQYLNRCDLVCVDGIGTALLLRIRTGKRVSRVVALHLFDALVRNITTPSTAVLIGVSADEVQRSARNINALNTGINIIASVDGFANEEDYARFLLKHQSVQWVLIGAGSPKSENIATQALVLCSRAIVFHIGAGTIKVYAGTKRRAPAWMSSMGLEWAHRTVFEPHTRERYTKGIVQFLKRIRTHQ